MSRVCVRGHLVEGANLGPNGKCRACVRVAVSPEEGVECLICGDILRVLGNHYRVHGITPTQYREQFPGAPVSGPLFRRVQREIWADKVMDGVVAPREKQEVCEKGHRMWGRNIYIHDGGRECRRCRLDRTTRNYHENHAKRRETQREYYLRTREEKLAKQKQYDDANREKIRKRRRKYYLRNQERLREKTRVNTAKRRAA